MDNIEKIDGTIIQHGKMSNRLYLMQISESFNAATLKNLESTVIANQYTKFFAKVPESQISGFLQSGFHIEAKVPGMYNGKETGCFISKFYDRERAIPETEAMENFQQLLDRENRDTTITDSDLSRVSILQYSNAEEMADVYQKVFASYPFPIFDPSYIKETMESHIVYFGIRDRNGLCAISSAETDMEHQYAEMTDFATLPETRGKGYAKILLAAMEKEMHKRNIKTAFTIARLKSIAMNKTFLGSGYTYAGTLVKNTNISGSIESMNVHYKRLDRY